MCPKLPETVVFKSTRSWFAFEIDFLPHGFYSCFNFKYHFFAVQNRCVDLFGAWELWRKESILTHNLELDVFNSFGHSGVNSALTVIGQFRQAVNKGESAAGTAARYTLKDQTSPYCKPRSWWTTCNEYLSKTYFLFSVECSHQWVYLLCPRESEALKDSISPHFLLWPIIVLGRWFLQTGVDHYIMKRFLAFIWKLFI